MNRYEVIETLCVLSVHVFSNSIMLSEDNSMYLYLGVRLVNGT